MKHHKPNPLSPLAWIKYWFPMALRPTKPVDPGIRANRLRKFWYWYRSKTFSSRYKNWYRKTYLWSYHWREEVRPAALRRDNYKCQHKGCRVFGDDLDVHHKTYTYLGREMERPEWFARSVTTLCREHHRLEHEERAMNFLRMRVS